MGMTAITSNLGFVCAGIPTYLAAVLVTGGNLTPARWVCALLHNTVSHGNRFGGAVFAFCPSSQLFFRDRMAFAPSLQDAERRTPVDPRYNFRPGASIYISCWR